MTFDSVSPALLVLGAFLMALVALRLARVGQVLSGPLMALYPLAVFVVLLSCGAPIWAGETWRTSVEWAPEVGIDWDLWVTPLGLLLALLVSGIGVLIVLYAGAYLKDSPRRGRFFGVLFLFMGAMLGLALTENLVVLFIFWEVTSVASYLLIGHFHEKEESRKSALDALLVTGGGGIVFLAGIILLGEVGGSYRLGELIESRDAVVGHALYPAIFLCVLVGAITKSAQVPFHFWLPGAMAAPAPVSAYLHSATMVKAGVFLLAIFHPLLGGTGWWHFSLLGIGAVTMTWGALVAMAQTDLKRLLAFSTVSALGTMVMLLGIETELAAKATVLFLVVHAFYKGALFMVAGILEKTTGTRDVEHLRGLIRAMPVLGIAAVLAAASMSGVPPFLGFIAKELLYEVKLESAMVGWPLLLCGVTANAANIVVALKVGVAPFLGAAESATPLQKKPGRVLCLAAAVLGFGSLLLGIFPDALLGEIIRGSVGQIRAEPVEITLKLWHGFNLVLLLSVVTMIAGVAAYLLRRRIRRLAQWISSRTSWNARNRFRAGLGGFLRLAGAVTGRLQSGDLHRYLVVILVSGIALVFWAFRAVGYRALDVAERSAFRFDVMIVILLIAAATVGLLRTRRRMTAILFLSCAGFGVGGLFALYGAPDLAITQLLVETLTLVLFALAVYVLPQIGHGEMGARGRVERVAMAGIAGVIGVVFCLLTLNALGPTAEEPVSREMAGRSLPEGYGRNVVNVILVDFRSLDTLGEIAVLAIAALGVAAMLGDGARGLDRVPRRPTSAVLLASARYTAPAMLGFSLYLLLRGHNEPGGGFIAGLVGALASVLTHLSQPGKELTFWRLKPERLVALGLGLALISGLPGWVWKGSFLAGEWGPAFGLPAVGKIKLGTPLVFDFGIYLTVAAVTMLLYRHLGNRGRHRPPGVRAPLQ